MVGPRPRPRLIIQKLIIQKLIIQKLTFNFFSTFWMRSGRPRPELKYSLPGPGHEMKIPPAPKKDLEIPWPKNIPPAEVVPRSGGTPGGTFEGVPRNMVPLKK